MVFDEESGVEGFSNPSKTNGVPGNAYLAPPSVGIFSPAAGPGSKKFTPNGTDGKDLHMFVWSSSASPVSQGGLHVYREFDHVGVPPTSAHPVDTHPKEYEEYGGDEFIFGNKKVAQGANRDGPTLSKLGSSSTTELHPKTGVHGEYSKNTSMPPASVMTRLILIMVWRKLIRNPNTFSSLIGLIWSLVSFRWGIQIPIIIAKPISILSDAGLRMAMFSLGIHGGRVKNITSDIDKAQVFA